MRPFESHPFKRHSWKSLPTILCLLLSPSLLAQVQDENNTRFVVLTVRGPSGRPLQEHAVLVSRIGFPLPDVPDVSTTTDSHGQVTVRMPVGFVRLHVQAPGVGYGMTGSIEVGLGQTTRATLPLLAPFARLTGKITPALQQPGETLFLTNEPSDGRPHPQAVPVDAQGQFALSDLPAGQVGLELHRVSPRQNLYFYYHVALGENKAGVVLALSPNGFSFPPYVPPTIRSITLRGHVTDDHSKPVAGATVYAKFPDPNPPMMGSRPLSSLFGPLPLSTVTAADGSYTFRNVGISSGGSSAALIVPIAAAASGHPPALTAARIERDTPGEVTADLVLSAQHTGLVVHVTTPDGRPAAGAEVYLRPAAGIPGIAAAPPSDQPLPYLAAGPGSGSDAVSRLFGPSGAAGPDGTVRFADLVPGLWVVKVGNPFLPLTTFRPRLVGRQDVAVQAGQSASCTVVLAPDPSGPTVQELSPDGRQIRVQGVFLEPGSRTEDTHLFLARTPGADDDSPLPALSEKPGLWRVTANYRDGAQSGDYYTSIPQPYNAANALLALSPALPPPGLLTLRARHRTAGVLRVRLEGVDGRPAAGTVVILGFPTDPGYAATVDSHGEAIFTDMPAGTYNVVGRLAGQTTSPTLAVLSSGNNSPLPTDAALTGGIFVPPQQAEVALDTETRVVLRATPAGFVRGRIVPAAGELLNAYVLTPRYLPGTGEADTAGSIDPKTGEFVYGPLPPGPATLPLECENLTLERPVPLRTISVNVVGGRVVSVGTVTAPPPPASSGPEAVSGIVLLHDATAPAWGAQVVLFFPSLAYPEYPTLTAQTPADALGHLSGAAAPTAGGFYAGEGLPPPSPPEQNPEVPTLIAWLPGLTGATVLPYTPGQPLRIVLPAANSVSGRVMVGGHSPSGLKGTLRVRAEYQGRGRLNDLLSLDATCQPDGTFTLNGLTVGTYRVQAARDGIWLSASQAVTVGDGPLPPLTLNIAPVGQPITLHLSPGEAVSLDRPAGPLTDLLWPSTVRADGIGDLRLDGLEAGHHFVQPDTSGPRILFDVPPVGAVSKVEQP